MTDVQVTREPLTYEREAPHSYFRDLVLSEVYDDDHASARQERHRLEMRVEKRTNPSTTLGQGGEFDIPLWLIDDEHVKTAARAGRTFADLVGSQLLPAGVSSVHIPKFNSPGFIDDIQPGQSDAEQAGDVTTTDINQAQVVTVAGEADVSQQLQDLSPTGFDTWAYKELHQDYNAKLENSLINGTGSNGQLLGISNFSIPTANTVAGGSLTAISSLWPAMGQAAAAITNGRLLQPECWLMAGRRWFWIASSVDNSNRPIDSPRSPYSSQRPVAGGYPTIGVVDGLPVYLSGAIKAGTTADNIYCVRPSDMALFESVERYSVFQSALSGTLQVRLSLHRYVGFVGNTYSNGLAVITSVPQPSNF